MAADALDQPLRRGDVHGGRHQEGVHADIDEPHQRRDRVVGVQRRQHTNDAISTLVRLINIGVDPFLVATAVNVAAAQRLVKRICRHCKEEYRPSPEEIAAFAPGPAPELLYRGRGCRECRNIGYAGRMALYEVFGINAQVRRMVIEGVDADTIRRSAADAGMMTLRTAGSGAWAGGHDARRSDGRGRRPGLTGPCLFEYEVADPRGVLSRGRTKAESQGALILPSGSGAGSWWVCARWSGRPGGRASRRSPRGSKRGSAPRGVSLETLLLFTGQLAARCSRGATTWPAS